MRRLLICAVFAPACLAVLATTTPARALVIAMPPPATRVAQADVIVVGRVVGMEDKDVQVNPFPASTAKVPYRVAVVRVSETVAGPKDLKTIRAGFPAPLMINPGGPKLIRPRPGLRGVNLKVGDEGLFYLTKSKEGALYLMPMYYDFTARENGNYAKELETVKTHTKLLEAPLTNLKSDDAEKRFLTAALLVARYRNFRNGNKTEPIDAAESKLILKALVDARWDAPVGRLNQLHPQMIFNQLGVTAKDGWQPPMKITTPQDYPNAIRAWLREHVDTYRIQRLVAGEMPAPHVGPR